MVEPALALTSARLPGWDGLWDVVLGDGLIRGIVPSGRVPVRRDVEMIDLDGRFLLPGLWDEHVHFSQWALYRSRVDVSTATSAAGTAALVAEHLRVHGMPTAGPLVGVGFRDGVWPDAPTAALLDEAAGGHEVVLFSSDIHCVWVSTAAARRLKIPVGPDGMAREAPAFAAQEAVTVLAPEHLDALILEAADAAPSRGVVGVVDLDMPMSHDGWRRRTAGGPLPFRVETAVYPELLERVIADRVPVGTALDDDGLLTLRYAKIITDGSLNTRTAYCHEPYPSLPGTAGGNGWLTVQPEELTELLRAATSYGLTPAVHAIGDEANRLALDVFASLGIGGRIEHAQLLREEDFPRFAELGITASVQPRHAPDDRDVAERLWPGRTGRAFALRSLLDAGARLAFGSDAPVSPLDPWVGLAAAVFRTADDRPAWHPEQAVTIGEALASSSRGRTTLVAGDPADLVAVERDPFIAGSSEQLATTPVAATLVAGRFSYRNL